MADESSRSRIEGTHVVVLGGGFAGVEAAIMLRREGFRVTLVSDRNFLYIYPISIWIPVGEIAFEDACQPLAPLAEEHGFTLHLGRVVGGDVEARTVTLQDDAVLAYDELVVAVGGAKMRMPGVEHTLSPCGPPEAATALRDRYDALLRRAVGLRNASAEEKIQIGFGFGGNPKDTSAVRGGPVFEVLLNVDHHLRKLRLRDRFELTFFAPMPEPARKMGAKAPQRMKAFLQKKDIGWVVGTKIDRFDPQGVHLVDGRHLSFDLTVFTPAGRGHPLGEVLGLPQTEAGFLRITPDCRVEGVEHVWAAGDAAGLVGPDWIAKQGHVAEAMGKIVAHNLALELRGGPADQRYSYQDHLSILCVMDTGDGATVVYRDDDREVMLPAPVVGHWMKQAWGTYWKKSKMRQVPRIPGL
jgi:sulfide:quinone oxidoreductase